MKRLNVYAVIREMREQIVKTMQERGITELMMFMSYKEWGKERGYKPDDFEEDETDDEEYYDYKQNEAPYVIYFDKYGCGCDYRVDKITLKDSRPVLVFDCYNSELGGETFGEDDLAFLTLYNVYDKVFDLLEIKDEPVEIVMAFGEQATDAYDEGFKPLKRVVKNGDGQLLRRKFGSQAEMDAYLQGLEDMNGWESSVRLSAADCARYAKEIDKLVE